MGGSPGSCSSRIAASLAVLAALAAAPAVAQTPAAPGLHALAGAPRTVAPGPAADPRGARLADALRSRRAALAAARASGARAAPARDQAAALERLRARAGADFELRIDPHRRTPRMIRGRLQRASAAGRGRAERTARAFLRDQRALLRLADPDTELVLARQERDALGRTHLRFRQRHRGVPVEPAELLVHLDPSGDVDVVNGGWEPTPRLDPSPAISASAAVGQARAEVAGGAAAEVPAPELIVWAPGDRRPRLAWSVFVPASVAEQWRVVIDARSGQRLDAWNTAMDQAVAGSGIDLLGVTRPIQVWAEGGTHYLVDAGKAMFDPASDPPDPAASRGVITILDARNQPPNADPQSIPPLFQITSAAASEPAAAWLADGVSALNNFSAVYDYFWLAHGRDSLDGQGGSILAIVRLGIGFDNAFFLSEQNLMAFGDGQAFAAALDVVGHELAHGVTFHSANLVYRDEPGALNEAMSDIFGEMVEASVDGAPDWLVGSPPALGAPLRNMANPGSLSIPGIGPYPAHYSQRYLGSFDNGGVHINSSIVNHAFYQLAAGIGGGVGIEAAAEVFYRALTVYLTANSRFVDARLACLQAATDLFGPESLVRQRVADAFDQVGIAEGPGTEPPPAYPGTEGDDSVLFLRYQYLPTYDDWAYFLYRFEPDLDGGLGPYPLSAWAVDGKRPSVTGDGELAYFIDPLDDVCSILTDGSELEELCITDPSIPPVASVAVAPRGDVYGFVMRNELGERLNEITVIDLDAAPPNDVLTYRLDAPVTVPSPTGGAMIATVRYADAMDITADGRYVIYDALNGLQVAGGGSVDVWSLYALDRVTGAIAAIVPPQPGWDVGYPALAQRSDNFLVFDAVDIESGVGNVLAGNLDSGEQATIASGLDGFAVPGYDGADARVVYSAPAANETGFELVGRAVSGWLAPQGAPQPWLDDADLSVVYRRGVFVPEPGAGMLGAVVVAALSALARRGREGAGSGPGR